MISPAFERKEESMSAGQTDKPFVISRDFDAPRDLVWKSWTEPERLKHWWGPKGFVVHTCKVDLRPGGRFHYGMSAPDGSDMWGRFVYREIDPPRRLVFITSFSDPDGGLTRHPGHLHWPLQLLSTVTFRKAGNRTTVTRAQDFPGRNGFNAARLDRNVRATRQLSERDRGTAPITAAAGSHWNRGLF
jgi:uncharacterized protein YndB with AHSA1/START domain